MTAFRILADLAAVMLSIAAAVLAIVSVVASREGGRDTLASLAPSGLWFALAGCPSVWLAFAPGPVAAVLFSLNGVGAVLSLATMAPEFLRLRPALGFGQPSLRILVGNIYWFNPSGERAVEAMLQRDADAVILQEAGPRLTGALAALEARYPHVAACAHADLMIYAKAPMIAHGCNCSRADTLRGRLLTATLSLSDGPTVVLATTHFSHPYRGDDQKRERSALAAAVSGLDVPRLILAGDFNNTPWSYGMRRQDEMLAPLRRWTIAWFTWPARLPRWRVSWPVPLLPIDHVYAGPLWRHARLRRVRIPGSDHFATEAALCLAPTTASLRGGSLRALNGRRSHE